MVESVHEVGTLLLRRSYPTCQIRLVAARAVKGKAPTNHETGLREPISLVKARTRGASLLVESLTVSELPQIDGAVSNHPRRDPNVVVGRPP